MSTPWLQRFGARPHATARLFCFPYAGGSAASFRLWAQRLPASLDVCAVQLPGRGNRVGEPPLASIAEMVDALVPALLPSLDVPFAFFGHSMGSMLAYATTLELARRGAPLPAELVVSGRRSPRIPDPDPPMHPLADDAFVSEINRRYAAIPAEVLCEPELMALLLPSLRADIRALETYRPDAAPLPCAVTALGGAEDPFAPRAHLEAWQSETRSAFRVRTFAGGHFYLENRRDELLDDLAASLVPALCRPTAQGARA